LRDLSEERKERFENLERERSEFRILMLEREAHTQK